MYSFPPYQDLKFRGRLILAQYSACGSLLSGVSIAQSALHNEGIENETSTTDVAWIHNFRPNLLSWILLCRWVKAEHNKLASQKEAVRQEESLNTAHNICRENQERMVG